MATKKKLNIYQAKRTAAGLSASSKSASTKSASRKSKRATAPEDEETAEDEDEETEAEGDEEETAEGEDEDVDAEGEDEETEASDDEEEDAEGEDFDDEEAEEEEPKPAGKKAKAKASSERGRISAILRSPAAKALPTLADALAFDSELGAKAAIGLLDAAHKDIGSTRRGGGGRSAAFRDAMNGSAKNPKVGFGGRGAARDEEDEAIAATSALAAEFGFGVAPKR